jgi:Protein of unknown function (DUF2514)
MIPWAFILKLLWPVALAVAIFGFGYSVGGASKQRAWDLANARVVKEQLAQSEAARKVEEGLRKQVQEAQNAREAERARNQRIAAGLRDDRDRLRDELAKYASGPPADTTDACHDRAAALGGVLAEALRSGEECAEAAESLASDVRVLRSAWPVAH